MKRDKWRCHICHRKTLRRLRGTQEELAPELDHIIPVAVGGSHTYDNCACSCHWCNHRKKDRIIGQLSLLDDAALRLPHMDGLSHGQRNYRDMRAKRDAAVMAAIDELTTRGEPIFIQTVSRASGVSRDAITHALNWERRGRPKPPWADLIRKMTPEEAAEQARLLFRKPPKRVHCRRCGNDYRNKGEGRGSICDTCREASLVSEARQPPEARPCLGCRSSFVPNPHSGRWQKFCSHACQRRNEPSRLDRRSHHAKPHSRPTGGNLH